MPDRRESPALIVMVALAAAVFWAVVGYLALRVL